jgi:hypothetical protein
VENVACEVIERDSAALALQIPFHSARSQMSDPCAEKNSRKASRLRGVAVHKIRDGTSADQSPVQTLNGGNLPQNCRRNA